MNLKFIQKGETFLAFHPSSITERTASQNIIQVQDLRGKVLYGTIEYPDDEEHRQTLYTRYEVK